MTGPTSPGHNGEEYLEANPEPNLSGREIDMEETGDGNNEGDFNTTEESDDPSTTLFEIRRCLGPISDLDYILVNRRWLVKIGF